MPTSPSISEAQEEVAKHLAKGKSDFGAPTKDQIKHHEQATDQLLKSKKFDHSDLEWFKDNQLGTGAKAAITKAVQKIVPSFKEKPENFSDDEYKEYNRKREAIRGALADYMAAQMFLKGKRDDQYMNKDDRGKGKTTLKDKGKKATFDYPFTGGAREIRYPTVSKN